MSALTIPEMIRDKLAAHITLRGMPFEFGDFQVLVTENELDGETIAESKSSLDNMQVSQLMGTKRSKVSKIFNYTIYNIRCRHCPECLELWPGTPPPGNYISQNIFSPPPPPCTCLKM